MPTCLSRRGMSGLQVAVGKDGASCYRRAIDNSAMSAGDEPAPWIETIGYFELGTNSIWRIIPNMQTTLSGKGTKCCVCTHPDRAQIESLLARGSAIAAIGPIIGATFSRRALYRHRAKHLIVSALPPAR